jgi:phosphate transport system permease protein
VSTVPTTETLPRGRRVGDRIGDLLFRGLTLAASLVAFVLVAMIAYKIFDEARPAFDKFGFAFLTDQVWDPNKKVFGAATFIFGTAVSSFIALLIAAPLAIAIGLFLSELAPRSVRAVISPLVELLAAIPSVVLGLWGILVLGPFVRDHIEPWLHDNLGFLPIFSGEPSQAGMLPAAFVLAIMVVPIVASISRELFLSVPREIEEGALALGSTRWEMVRGVVLPYAKPGIVAALILGLGRAIGEAIAVTQVIGGFAGINKSLFAPADTLASRLASQYQGAPSSLQISALVYLAAILLVISLIVNLIAQLIVRRFEFQRVGAD